MWDKAVIDMIIAGIGETLYMTLVSTFSDMYSDFRLVWRFV